MFNKSKILLFKIKIRLLLKHAILVLNVALKRAVGIESNLYIADSSLSHFSYGLTIKTIEGTSLAFRHIDNVHNSDSLFLDMFTIGDSIMDKVLQEDFMTMKISS